MSIVWINNNKTIKMIKITGIQGIEDEGKSVHKIALFADDVLFFIENPPHSIPPLSVCMNMD